MNWIIATAPIHKLATDGICGKVFCTPAYMEVVTQLTYVLSYFQCDSETLMSYANTSDDIYNDAQAMLFVRYVVLGQMRPKCNQIISVISHVLYWFETKCRTVVPEWLCEHSK